ncbi:hypothetical protein K493DRAFT_339266 [Basidiobolus meristosporus CBS 931.73]|uniref:SGNH hydrolase n=1 Tax=Basidiobolus meristosporus CBS 931.73 TaxID=1314790 RepID=A0A1Y1Y1W1_9FUNG|nr:hypothetical protein K493DRAFT_339266 [Basidiobolus meristosporus CBS 931.73]|eukprot:ORX91614.1 hypothetical protein K493DRAFT_339266 [Basidiobolus meristosporus CBS 931.73]
MRRTYITLSYVSIAWHFACLITAQRQPSIQSLVVIGDGYSDTGNTFTSTSNHWPQRPYFRGRFSNDQVWSELASPPLNVPLLMYAYGGCRADEVTQAPNVTESLAIPSITQQVEDFLAVPPDRILRALVVIFFNGLEFLDDPEANPYQMIRAFRESIYRLTRNGVHNIILTTLPPLDRFPGARFDRIKQDRLRTVVDAYNRQILSLAAFFAARRKVVLWDIHRVFVKAMEDGTFPVTHRPCIFHVPEGYASQCENTDDYLFWDPVHVTLHMHRLLAKSFIQQVASSWPDVRVWGDI